NERGTRRLRSQQHLLLNAQGVEFFSVCIARIARCASQTRRPEHNFSASLRLSVATRTRYQNPLVPTLDWITNGWRVSNKFLICSCWNDASAEACEGLPIS